MENKKVSRIFDWGMGIFVVSLFLFIIFVQRDKVEDYTYSQEGRVKIESLEARGFKIVDERGDVIPIHAAVGLDPKVSVFRELFSNMEYRSLQDNQRVYIYKKKNGKNYLIPFTDFS